MPIPDHVINNDRIPAKVDRAHVKAMLRIDPELAEATDQEIDSVLADLDQDALYDSDRPNWSVEVWDRKSPINGVAAKDVLERRIDIPDDGDVYLVRHNDQIVYFQPHEPDVEGIVPVPKGQGRVRGSRHADEIVAQRTASEVLRRVREGIRTNRSS